MSDLESAKSTSMPHAGAKSRNSVARGIATVALAAVLALPYAPPARAAEIEAPMPIAATIDGRRIDAFGVLPGMTPEQVRGILEPMGFAEKDRNEKELNWKQDGVVVWRTPGFVSRVTFHKPGAAPAEEIVAEFTSGVSGNQLVAVTRSLDWTSGRVPLGWDHAAATAFAVKEWGSHSGYHIPADKAHIVFWYRFVDGKIATCPRTPDGMAESCGEGGNFGGPHTVDRYRRFSDVLMRIVIWNHEGKVARFEQVVDDYRRRDHAQETEAAEAEARVKHVLAGGDKPPSKPKPTFSGIKVPTDVKVKQADGKAASVENIATGKAK